MSDGVTIGQMSPSEASLLPPERAFQVDPNGLGGIAQSVNLFRGDANLPITLASLKSRSGISADLTLTYASGLGVSADTWNMDAPTGLLGLGWSLGYDMIVRDATLAAQPTSGLCYLIANGASNRLYRTAILPDYWEYEAETYQFWRIRFYPATDQWIVWREDGVRYVYGGASPDLNRSPVQYGVKWPNAAGLWSDATIKTSGQNHYAVGWNLAQIVSPWGEAILLEYENELVRIGDGLPYTVASRLSRVTAPTVQTITLNYAPKIYGSQIREYQIPHLDAGAPSLHAYQDRLTTVFLDSIDVRTADDAAAPGRLVQRTEFDYQLACIPKVKAPLDPADFYKRYLTAIRQLTPEGLPQPSMRFSYFNDPDDPATSINPGALKTILYPQGGSVRLTYATAQLTGASRSLTVQPKAASRVWFGPSYTVIATYNGPTPGLQVTVYMWNGQWVSDSATYAAPSIDLASLDLSAQPEMFALHFVTAGVEPTLNLILFHMRKGAYGAWVKDAAPATAPLKNGKQALVATGVDFAIAVASGGAVLAKVWVNRLNAWSDQDPGLKLGAFDSFALSASANFFALASFTPSTGQAVLQVWYRNASTSTFSAARIDRSTISKISWDPDSTPQNFWSLAPQFAAMTYATSAGGGSVTYSVDVLQWDDSFNIRTVNTQSRSVPDQTKLPYLQTIVSGSVIGNLGNLLRYNGVTWDQGTLDVGRGDTTPYFAYGADLALTTQPGAAAIAAYNPYATVWTNPPIPPSTVGLRPTINAGYITVDRQVYYQDNTGVLQPIGALDPNMRAGSLVNSAPNFLAYENGAGDTIVIPLRNGQMQPAIRLANQRIYVPDAGAGAHLVGPASLVTYQGDFAAPTGLTLHQFVNEDIQGPLTAPVVLSIKINDGYADAWGGIWPGAVNTTRYYYDCDNVTLSPDGSVSAFAAATAVYAMAADDGSPAYPPPSNTFYGQSEYRYYNDRAAHQSGLHPIAVAGDLTNDYPSLLNGLLFDKTDYAANGQPVERLSYAYAVGTQVADISDPSRKTNLIGAYIRRTLAESATYQSAMPVDSLSGGRGALGAALARGGPTRLSGDLRALFASAIGEANDEALLVPERRGEGLRLYPDPKARHYLPIRLEGEEVKLAAAVVRRVTTQYSDQTGLVFEEASDSFNSDGVEETVARQACYAWQVPDYAEMADKHIWSPVAVSVRLWRPTAAPSEAEVQAITLTTYQPWGGIGDATAWAPSATYNACGPTAYAPSQTVPVTFTGWTGAPPPSNSQWRLTGRTTARGISGAALEVWDAVGSPTTTLLDNMSSSRVAGFVNAALGEATYCGFEVYEDLSAWTLKDAAIPPSALVSGDAHTGSACLRLAPGSGPLATQLSLRPGRTYILACWIRTPAGFAGDSGACAWTLRTEDAVLASFPIDGTSGEWAWRHFVVTAPPGEAAIPVRLIAQNDKTSATSILALDDIMLAPLTSASTAAVSDPVSWLPTAEVALNGGTTRHFYDSRLRLAFSTRPDAQVLTGGEYNLVRQGDESADFTFPAGRPNSLLTVKAEAGGAFADFEQADRWRLQWTTPTPDAWTAADGRLTHTAATADTIAFVPTSGLSDYGLRLTLNLPMDEAGSPITPTQALGLGIGDRLSLLWTPDKGWAVTLAGHTQVLGGALGADWNIQAPVDPVSGQTAVLIFVDGVQIFAALDTGVVSGLASITVGDPGIGFSSIGAYISPRLSTVFLDGSGKERQRQTFTGTGVIAAGTIYDTIGRAALGVKPAESPGRALDFIADYVTGFDTVSGVMTGRAADAYPNDDGYPYVRTQFLATAQSLVAAQGSAGKDLAIIYAGSPPEPQNPHVVTHAYGSNVQGEFGDDWPTGQYLVTRTNDANGAANYAIKTKLGQDVGQMSSPPPQAGGDKAIFQYFFDHSGRQTRILPPNGVAAKIAGVPDADAWASTITYDFLGQSIATASPDSGATQFVFDAAGRVRFMLDANGAAPAPQPDTIVYSKYDDQNRIVEEGVFEAVWDRARLEAIALTDPAWPEDTTPHTVAQSYAYDGDGSDPNAFGRLIRSVAHSESGASASKSFTYDAVGNLVGVTQVASAYDLAPRAVGYAYNNLGDKIRLDYPSGSPIPSVTFAYDRVARVFGVGDKNAPASIAHYAYNALSAIVSTTAPLDGSRVLSSTRAYGPASWLNQMVAQLSPGGALFTETLTYTSGGYGGVGYYDGKIASAATASPERTFSYAYAYDGLSRLAIAQRSEAGKTVIDAAQTYDLNGNIQTLADGQGSVVYDYGAHSNQVTTVTGDSGPVDVLTYDPAGGVTSTTRLGLSRLTYDPATGMTSAIALEAGQRTLSFSYGVDHERVVKRLTSSTGQELSARLYVRDQGGAPLFEQSRGDGAAADTQFIYGPEGLATIARDGVRYTVIRDHLGSVRRVVDGAGAVVASFDYGPWGIMISQPGGQADIFLYRYTGQELDSESGLYNYHARFYDPVLGRFIDIDPAQQGASPYAYVLGDPISGTDPDGRFAWIAFLIIIAISAAVGAVTGAITYAVSHQGNFDVGKFFLYALVGAAAGAAGGAAGYLGGLMATATLTAIGVSTSTSIASGVVVGAAAGAADGAVSGVVNQMGVNLIEGRPVGEGVGTAAWMGAAIGGGIGAVAGGVTGAIHARTSPNFDKPFGAVGPNPNRVGVAAEQQETIASSYVNGPTLHVFPDEIGPPNGALNQMELVHAGRMPLTSDNIAVIGHGGPNAPTLTWYSGPVAVREPTNAFAQRLQASLGHVQVTGIDLVSCYGYVNGSAKALSRQFGVPIRAATDIQTVGGGRVWISPLYALRGGAIRTYYPNQLQTSWNYLFGY